MAKTRFRILGFRFLNGANRNYGGSEYYVRAMQKAHFGHNEWIMFYQHVHANVDNLSFLIEDTLYDDEHIFGTDNLAIGVCAIVGQNGSGKSTILDMVIRVLNNVAASLAGEDVLYSAAEHLHYIENVYGAILFLQDDNVYQLCVEGHNITLVEYAKTEINGGVTYKEKEERTSLLTEDEFKAGNLLPLRAKDLMRLSSFFYTVVINYSLYAYYYNDYYQEATDEGKLNKLKRKPKLKEFPFEQFWMTGLFHKNDGYQTPVVINPMRVGGRIDAPKENYLAKERILSLLFVEAKDGADKDYNERYPFRVINGNLHIMALSLPERQDIHLRWTKEWMLERGYFGNRSRLYQKYDEYSEFIIDYFNEYYGIDTTVKHYLYATRYLVYKIFKIGLTYMNYNCIISNLRYADFSHDLLNSHLKSLMEDDTHITVKLRRVVMYLSYGNDVYGQPQDNGHPFVYELRDIEPKIEKAMEDFNAAKYPFVAQKDDFLPPPIFDIEFRMIKRNGGNTDYAYTDKDVIPFSGLSSGERQIAYTMSNFAYHLVNINSVWRSKAKKVGRAPLLQYRYINAIFDEIELYYHPELQRRFLALLLNMLRDIELSHIEGINIMLVTHSPFVLSDIPRSNVLALGGDSTIDETFCANIHEMLNQSFFMHYTMGEVSQTAIEEFFSAYKDFTSSDNKQEFANAIGDFQFGKFEYLSIKVADEYLRKTINRMLEEMRSYRIERDTPENIAVKIRAVEAELEELKERQRQLNHDQA